MKYLGRRISVFSTVVALMFAMNACSSDEDNSTSSENPELTRDNLEDGVDQTVCSDEFIKAAFQDVEAEVLQSEDISSNASENINCEVEIGSYYESEDEPSAVHKTNFWAIDLLSEDVSYTFNEADEALSHGTTVCEAVTEFPLPGFENDLYADTDYKTSEIAGIDICVAEYKSIHNLASSRDRPVQSVITFLHEGYLVQTSVVSENKMNTRGNSLSTWLGALVWEVPTHQEVSTAAFEGIFDLFTGQSVNSTDYPLDITPDEIVALCDESAAYLEDSFFDSSTQVKNIEEFSQFSPNYNCGTFGFGSSVDSYDEIFTRSEVDDHFQAFVAVDVHTPATDGDSSCDAAYLDVFGMSEPTVVDTDLNDVNELCIRHMTKESDVSGLISATWVSDEYQGEVLVAAYGIAEHLFERGFDHAGNDSAVAEIAADILEADESELSSVLGV